MNGLYFCVFAVGIPVDTEAPTVPLNLMSSGRTDTTVTLQWDASTDNVGVTGYEIYRDDIKIAELAGINYTDTGLLSGLTYEYTVKAVDAEGNLSQASEILSVATIDVLAPSVPSNLAAVNNTTGTSVELSWSPSTDNVGVSEYEVYCDGSLAGTTQSTSFVAAGLQMVTTYVFSVNARDDAGNISQSSSEISVTTPDTEAPVAPDSILQTEITNSSISIEWIPATDNIGVTGYDIYNGTALAGSSDTNVFTLSGLSAGELCVFSVKAKDAAGNESEASPSITLKTNFNGGMVTKDTVINSSDSPYIIEENLTVASGVNLQIMPGSVIKLNPGVAVTVNGRINAAGTNESPVVFTSVKDPDYGGTGLDNDADYWGCISISGTGEFDGEYIKIKYASTAFNVNGKLDLNCSDILNTSGNSVFIASGYDVSITNTNIEDAGIGIAIGVSNPGTGDLTIEGNSIKDCGHGVVIHDYNYGEGSLIIENNTITSNRVNGISIYGFTAGTPSIKGNVITNNSWLPISISLNGIRIPLADKIINNTLTGNSFAGKPCNSVGMYGSLSFDMTLTNNNSYLLDNITVNSGSTLTIQQGTVVKVPGNRIDVQGMLNAVGTASSPIVFTSMDDPDYGGTGIYDEGNGWEGISIAGTGEFNGEYVKAKYGGRSMSAGIYAMGICRLLNSEICNSFAVGIKISSSGIVTVENNTIYGNFGGGIHVESYTSDALSVQGNQIGNNTGYPISVNLTDMVQAVFYEIKNNTLINNTVDGIPVNRIAITGNINNNFVFIKDEYIAYNTITVAQDKTLTFEPGVIMKYMKYSQIYTYGKINAIGTIDNPIVFTLIKDLAYGGIGIEGDYDFWIGIYVEENGELYCDYAKFRHPYQAINVNGGKSHITNSEINGGYLGGINVWNAKELIVQNSKVNNCNLNGIYLGNNDSQQCSTLIEGNTISGCRYGIQISSQSTDHGSLIISNNTISDNEDGIITGWIDSLDTFLIDNNTIENNNSVGIEFDSPISTENISVYSVTNNKIKNNTGYPIYLSVWQLSQAVLDGIYNNIIEGNYADGGPCDGIAIEGCSLVSDITLEKGYYFINSLSIPENKKLTLEPGVIIKYSPKWDIFEGIDTDEYNGIYIDGRVDAIGTAEDPIIITVMGDPLYGGNGTVYSTNGTGIYINSTGSFYGENVKIRYGGGYSEYYPYKGSASINVGGILYLKNSVISNSIYGGISYNTELGTLVSGNTFENNNNFGVNNSTPETVIIDVSQNFWSSLDGPSVYDYETEGWIGNGDKVGDGVIYTPWLGSENKIQSHFGKDGANTATGNYSKSFTDMSANVPGFEVSLSRTYNSMNKNNGSLGKGWTFGFEGNISDYKYNNETVKKKIVKLPNGGSMTFDYSTGVFKADDSRNKLERLNDGSYILTTIDQYSYGFDTNGFMSWMKDKNGNKLAIQVDSAGKVQNITDPSGRSFIISYNTDGLIQSISDPAGKSITYQYENGMLVRVINRNGSISRYSYDSQGFLTELRDNDSNLIESIVYKHSEGSDQDKVDHITDSFGNTRTYTYDNVKGITTITDSNGRVIAQNHDNSFDVTKSVDMEGKTTVIEYYKDADGINRYGEEKTVTDRNGNKKIYVRNTDTGNITRTINPDFSTKEMDYDDKNNLISEKDEMGKCTYYIYNSNKINLVRKVQPLNGTDVYSESADQSRFAITEYTYYTDAECQTLGYTAKGLLKSQKDPEGKITAYEYDTYGNIKSVTDPMGNKTSNEYDALGRKTKITTPKGYKTDFIYDDNGNLLKKITNGGETTEIKYDAEGRKIEEISPNLYAAGKTGYVYTYYTNGNIETSTDPEGNLTSYTYDYYGNKTTETKPNGAVYTFEYDVMNRPLEFSFSENSTAAPSILETYSYEILTDGKTRNTTVKYLDYNETAVKADTFDYAGRRIGQSNPDNSTITMVYNENGTLKSSTDGNGNTTYYSYDGLNRLTEKWTPFEKINNIIKYTYTSISYDNAGNKVSERIGKDTVNLYDTPNRYIIQTYKYYDNGKVSKVAYNDGRKTEYAYDEDGNTTREDKYIDSTNKNTVEYTYNHFGKPVETKVHVNPGDINDGSLVLTTTYTYDSNGNLKTQTTPDGVTTTYEYDSMDRNTVIKQPGQDENGNLADIITETDYNWEGKPLTVEDPNGNTTQNVYNQRGLLAYTIDAKGGTSAFGYDNAGRRTVEISPKNYISGEQTSNMNRAVYVYDKMDRVLTKSYIGKYTVYNPVSGMWNDTTPSIPTVIKAYTYDNNGNVLKEQDTIGYNNGYGTEYAYNCANKPVTVLDPVSKDRNLPYTAYYTYDAMGRKITETNAKGSITIYGYDDAGNVTSVSVKKSASDAAQEVKSGTYDLLGNALTGTDGNGNTTVFEYNALNKVKTAVYPSDTTIDANTVIYEYDKMGNLISTNNSLGRVDINTYDNQGRVLSSTQQKEDGTESITVSTRYDRNGNKRFEIDGRGTVKENIYDALNKLVSTSISGKTTTYGYDADGNQTTQTDWRGNICTNTYDALDRLIEKKDPNDKSIQKLEYNGNNIQIKTYDALDNMTGYVYDKNNRLISTTDPASHTSSQTYDNAGNIATKTDGRNNTTTYEYDELNRLVSLTNARNEITSYTYDLSGNLLTQTDAKSNTTSFTYNAANKIKEKIWPNGSGNPAKTENYEYYADRSLRTVVDRNGNTTEYTYDIHGRLVNKEIGTISISYTYDNNGNQLTMTDATGTTERVYDVFNRVISKSVPDIGTSTYNYDIIIGLSAGFTAENSTDPRGNTAVKTYDRAGRLISVLADGNTTTYGYYDNGSRRNVIYPDGSREEFTYNADNLPETLINKRADGTVMDTYNYTYDSAHNQLTKEETIIGVYKGITAYTYDVLNRLATVTEPSMKNTAYTFDAAGNRVTETITEGLNTTVNTYSYDDQNRLTGIITTLNGIQTQTTAYVYDNNGNQTETIINGVTTVTNEYDMLDQMTETITGSTTVNNTYNGEGYRVEKSVNGTLTRYLYEYDKVVLEVDSNGIETARNVYGVNLISRTLGSQTLYYMYNGHADIVALVDAQGQIAATYYYDAFGNILEQTGSVNNNIMYAGYQYDKETGLYYLNARMYDPRIARFMQEDTYTGNPNDPLSLNLYTYCHNEPIMYIDPTGHWSEKERADAIKSKLWSVKDIDTMDKLTKDWQENNLKMKGLDNARTYGGMASSVYEQEYKNAKTQRDASAGKAKEIWDKYKPTNGINPDRNKVIGQRNQINTWSDMEVAKKNLVSVTIPAWSIDKKTGEKLSTNFTFSVNKELAPQVKQIFTDIYNDPEKFPVKQVGSWRWGSQDFASKQKVDENGKPMVDKKGKPIYVPDKVKYPNHPSGTAIDINWDNNGMYKKDKSGNWNLLAGGKYDTSNQYTLTPDSSVVKIFKKYGWDWGGDWKNTRDYMHFSYLGG